MMLECTQYRSVYNISSHSVVPRPTASTSPGHVIEMQCLQPHPRSTESESGCGSATLSSQALRVILIRHWLVNHRQRTGTRGTEAAGRETSEEVTEIF